MLHVEWYTLHVLDVARRNSLTLGCLVVGMTIGSVGQYPLTPDYDENILFEDVKLFNSEDGAYIKSRQRLPQTKTGNGDTGG